MSAKHANATHGLTEQERAILLNFKKPDSERERYPNPKWNTWEDIWRRAGVTEDEGLELFNSLYHKGYFRKDVPFHPFVIKLSRKAEQWLQEVTSG